MSGTVIALSGRVTTDARFKLERRGDVPESDEEKLELYRSAIELFHREQLPFLVAGTHAYYRYTGVSRQTKDFDIFIKREDYPRFEATVRAAGFDAELTFPHWLGKIYKGKAFIDVIFAGGNGEAPIDDEWFEHSVEGKVFGLPVRLCAPEEMIWSKTYVMERERYDGGDVMHLLLRTGKRLDWQRLVRRFGPHWRLLLMQLIKFGFVYPSERHRIPREVMDDLLGRLGGDLHERAPEDRVCYGTLTSRAQYLVDINEWGFKDARLAPYGTLDDEAVDHWTAAIEKK